MEYTQKRKQFDEELTEKLNTIEYEDDDDYINKTIDVIVNLETKYGLMV